MRRYGSLINTNPSGTDKIPLPTQYPSAKIASNSIPVVKRCFYYLNLSISSPHIVQWMIMFSQTLEFTYFSTVFELFCVTNLLGQIWVDWVILGRLSKVK